MIPHFLFKFCARAYPSLVPSVVRTRSHYLYKSGGFTLVETLVAISILALAIVAPMTLTTQSLTSAYYARDQMTAFHLAQEAIESVRAARDENILSNNADLLAGIPSGGVPFVIDTRDNKMTLCDQGNPAQCPYLRTSENASAASFYAYGPVGTIDIYSDQPGWESTRFRRTIAAEMISGSNNDEMKVTVTVAWQTGAYQLRTVTMRENLYRWITNVGGP